MAYRGRVAKGGMEGAAYSRHIRMMLKMTTASDVLLNHPDRTMSVIGRSTLSTPGPQQPTRSTGSIESSSMEDVCHHDGAKQRACECHHAGASVSAMQQCGFQFGERERTRRGACGDSSVCADGATSAA